MTQTGDVTPSLPIYQPQADVYAPPTVRASFLGLLSAANGVVWLAVIPLYSLLLPRQVALLDPLHKVSDLSFLSFLAGITALLAQPITGALSDRTTSRFGRRRPWILGSMLATVGALIVLAHAQSIPVLALALAGFGYLINSLLAALLALIPDRVPTHQRAIASAFVGMAQPIGTLIGMIAIASLVTITSSYYLIAGLLGVVVFVFLLFAHEPPVTGAQLPQLQGTWRNLTRPFQTRDFSFAWFARFWIIGAQTLLATYLLFFLQDTHLVDLDHLQESVAHFQVIQTVTLILSSVVTGLLSDRLQRRKLFVIVAGSVMTGAFVLLAFAHSWALVLVVAGVFGTGFGMFIAGDLALTTQVLPDAATQGKDMGLMTAAAILPELFFPLITWGAFRFFGGYSALFLFCAIACVLGGLCILPIKRVR